MKGMEPFIEMEGEQAYLIAGNCVLRYTQCWQSFDVLDVVNQQFPSLLGSYGIEKHDPGPPYAEPVSIQNNIAYINTNTFSTDQEGLAVLDVSQPSTPTLLSLYQPPIPPSGYSYIAGAAITGTYGLLSVRTQADDVFTNSLQVFDVSNPFTFTELTSYPMTYPGRIFLQSGLGFVVDNDQPWPGQTLKFTDLSQLPQVQFLSSITIPEAINDVAYDGRYAYVADGQAGLRVIDLSDLSQPQEVYAYHTIGNAVGVSVDGDWVYLADQDGGLLILCRVTPQFYLPFLSLADAP